MWPCYRTGKLLKHPLVAEASVRLGFGSVYLSINNHRAIYIHTHIILYSNKYESQEEF